MSTISFSSSSDIEFEGGDAESINTDYLSDEMIATKANYSAMNNMRILVVKALIDIFVEGLSFEEQSKKKLRDGIIQALNQVDIIPSHYNLPIVTEVTNQIRQNLEKMIVTSLKDSHATNNNPEASESAVQQFKNANGKISMNFCWEKICMPSRYRDEFEEVELLGKGGFGSVFKAKKKSDGNSYAIKRMELHGQRQIINLCIGEVQQMVRLSHPNIIRFFTSWTELKPFQKKDNDDDDDDDDDEEDDDEFTATSSRTDTSNALYVRKNGANDISDVSLYIQMELCNEDLAAWLVRRNSDKASKSCDNKEMVKQILKGVQYLHDSQVLHRDLKPQNILINWSSSPSNFVVKITDFGLSRVLNTEHLIIQNDGEKNVNPNDSQELTVGVGTVPYISPEQKENSNYDFKSDIYCVGLMAYEIFWPMYTGSEKLQNFEKLERSIICKEFENESKTMSDFVLLLTKRTPQERPTAIQALSHSCLEGSISPDDISDFMAMMKSLEERLKTVESEYSKLKVKLSSCNCSKS